MPSRIYAPLIAYLATQDRDAVTLTFAEIEAIIGAPLSVSAQVAPSYWTNAPTLRLVHDLRLIGWQAHLEVRAHAVAFRRVAGEQEV